MGQTPVYGIPYPELNDPADVPTDMRQIAEDFETKVGIPLDGRMDALEAGVGGFVMLGDTKLAAPAALIDFTSIPQTYAHLLVVVSLRTLDNTIAVNGGVRVNGRSASYYGHGLGANAAAASAAASINANHGFIGVLPGATAPAEQFGRMFVLLPDYTRAASCPGFVSAGFAAGGVTAAGLFADMRGGFSGAAAEAVNRVSLLSSSGISLAIGSRATLFGLRGT